VDLSHDPTAWLRSLRWGVVFYSLERDPLLHKRRPVGGDAEPARWRLELSSLARSYTFSGFAKAGAAAGAAVDRDNAVGPGRRGRGWFAGSE
jgi:hypothetical protein